MTNKIAKRNKQIANLYHLDDDYFKKVEEDVAAAENKINLVNEIILLRAKLIEFNEKAKCAEKLISHYDSKGNAILLGDKGKAAMLIGLTRAIGSLAKTDYETMLAPSAILEEDFIVWLGALARAVKAIKDEDFKKLFVNLMHDVGLPQQKGAK